MKIIPLAVSAACLLACLSPLVAQTPPAAPAAPAAGNLIKNGGFELSSPQENVWDGVESTGYLAAHRGTVKALTQAGAFNDLTMPVSVAAGDLNGDGLLDIMSAETAGYLHVFFNSGTKTEPVFTNSEITPFFVSEAAKQTRNAPRISLFDWSRRGVLDLMIGNYTGELIFIQNTGTPTAPDYRRPPEVQKSVVETAKGGVLWGNLFAPAAFDFNKDGRIDVAVGEGSYSANSVHLLLNQGSNSVPKFDETNRSYLAYGDGREHLTPAIVDFNGDGEMDILAANREGKIGIYLNPGPSWKPGTDFKFKEDLKFGASPTLGGYVTITTADMNGDGLFDLLVGKANGRVALATNIGSATEPKFNAPIELKGTDIWGKTVRTPNEWVFSVGFNQGNTYATASCITEADEEKLGSPEGKSVLRVGYVPSPNKIMKVPSFIAPGDPAYLNMLDGYLIGTPSRVPGNTALLRHNVKEITVGATYTLTMKVRGSNASAVKWTFGWRGEKVLAPDKVEKGDRDAAKVTRFVAAEDGFVDGTITVGPAWTTVTKTFTVNKFKNKDLEDVTKVPGGLEIRGTLTPNTGALYIDDVQIAPKM